MVRLKSIVDNKTGKIEGVLVYKDDKVAFNGIVLMPNDDPDFPDFICKIWIKFDGTTMLDFIDETSAGNESSIQLPDLAHYNRMNLCLEGAHKLAKELVECFNDEGGIYNLFRDDDYSLKDYTTMNPSVEYFYIKDYTDWVERM